MAMPRVLARPPIKEALVDIRMATEIAVDAELLKPLQEELAAAFPDAEVKRQMRVDFRVEGGKLAPPAGPIDLGFHGVWLKSADGTRLVQFRPGGFTFNNLNAYIGGDALIQQALDLWTRFVAVARPVAATRVALRYLNRLELPLREGDDFRRFLTAAPELPEGAPQKVSSFLSRIVAHDIGGGTVIVTQKLEETEAPPIGLLIDVDAFISGEHAPNAETLRPLLGQLRDLKNRTFFSLLTEEAVKLYV